MALEHPPPTDATAKYLYAHAYRCAFVGCQRPLYRVDEETGERTLNSRICHICARREGGPRWEPDQSADDNRSEKNLLLMCLEHASAIDDPALVETYPAARLVDWKAKQLADFDKLRQGWVLDDEMARQALEASSLETDILVVDSTINLGGAGGVSPGAGGGGGGSIGRNSRGGKGGDGGGFRIDQDEYTMPLPNDFTSPIASDDVEVDAGLDFVPGAGGGGAGAVGEGAVGGDGGGGGERVVSFINLEELREAGFDHAEVVIGEPGKGSHLPGQHGIDGEDTYINFVKADGRILKTVRARGGVGGRSGDAGLPEGVSDVTPEETEAGFRITTLMPVNGLEFRDGLIFVLGGGWCRCSLPQVPSDIVWSVLGTARWRRPGRDGAGGIYLSLTSPSGKVVATRAVVIPINGNSDGCLHWLESIGASVDVGMWTIRAHTTQETLAEFEVAVELVEPSE